MPLCSTDGRPCQPPRCAMCHVVTRDVLIDRLGALFAGCVIVVAVIVLFGWTG